MGKPHKVIIVDKAMKDKVVELYQQNVPIEKIAELVFIPSSYVRDIIRTRIAEGTLKNRGRINPNRRRVKEKPVPKPKPKPEKIEYFGDGWVRCTKAISKTCVYGCAPTYPSKDKCNYILVKHKSRGCPWERCTKYQRIDAEHPRLYKEFVEPPKVAVHPFDAERYVNGK